MKVRVKCHSVLAFEQNNRIVNTLCAAFAHASKAIVGGEIKKAYLLWRSVLFFFLSKRDIYYCRQNHCLKTLLFLVSYSSSTASLRFFFYKSIMLLLYLSKFFHLSFLCSGTTNEKKQHN